MSISGFLILLMQQLNWHSSGKKRNASSNPPSFLTIIVTLHAIISPLLSHRLTSSTLINNLTALLDWEGGHNLIFCCVSSPTTPLNRVEGHSIFFGTPSYNPPHDKHRSGRMFSNRRHSSRWCGGERGTKGVDCRVIAYYCVIVQFRCCLSWWRVKSNDAI